MPSRNIIKIYLENAYYHVYNRGVEGRDIFNEDSDYKFFLSLVKRYLIGPSQNEVRPRWKIDLPGKLHLSAYCLMPNHFHLLIKQISKDGITKFMRALMDGYVKYFNQKHKRVGGLFQSRFKAALIEEESYLLHLTRYIHLNPLEVAGIATQDLEDYYSSYGEYIGKRKTRWIHRDEVLEFFGSKLDARINKFNSYRDFVEKYEEDPKAVLDELILE